MTAKADGAGRQDVLAQRLRHRAHLARLVASRCDFFALPQVAQDALYGLAGELEAIADELAAREADRG